MKLYLETKDFSVTQEHFELQLNEELDLLVTHPVPHNLQKYYESEEYISHTDSNKTVVDKIFQYVKRLNLRNKFKIVCKHSSGIKLLDVGAGTGDFLVRVKRNGWSAKGVEPNEKAKMKAAKKGIVLKTSLDELGAEKYDVITLWHVLEHLPNLADQVARLSTMLTDDGILIIAVPNYKSYDARYYKNHWAAFDVPRHLWHFSRTAISKVFSKEGLQVTKVYPMLFDAFYVSLLSEKHKYGKQNLVAAFFIGMCSNIHAWHTKEYSSLIYVLERCE